MSSKYIDQDRTSFALDYCDQWTDLGTDKNDLLYRDGLDSNSTNPDSDPNPDPNPDAKDTNAEPVALSVRVSKLNPNAEPLRVSDPISDNLANIYSHSTNPHTNCDESESNPRTCSQYSVDGNNLTSRPNNNVQRDHSTTSRIYRSRHLQREQPPGRNVSSDVQSFESDPRI